MRSLLLAAVLGLVAASTPVGAGQEPMTDQDYEAAMKEIRFTVSDIQGHIDARYWPELDTAVGRLQSYFTQVEAFWTDRGRETAAGFAQDALQALEGVMAASTAEDQGAARDAVKALQGTCASCHMEFREETPDGYRIKP